MRAAKVRAVSIVEVMICWTPPIERRGRESQTCGMVKIVAWPDRIDASDPFDACAGACDLHIHKFDALQRRHFVMSVALGMIMNYAMDPKVVHRALWQLKEYRDGLPPDTDPPEAEQGGE